MFFFHGQTFDDHIFLNYNMFCPFVKEKFFIVKPWTKKTFRHLCVRLHTMHSMHVSLNSWKHTCTHSHNVLALTRIKTYIWQTVSSRVGQLAGIKLDPWVPHCSAGLKAILKASHIVLHQWESMDSGQGKQPGASHTPGGLHLLSLYTMAPLCSAWHIVPCAHMPVVPDYMFFNTWTWMNTSLIVCISVLCDSANFCVFEVSVC